MQREASYDVVILGAGSGGKPLAGELSRAGLSVVVAEQSLVGGECPYLACIPSKAMLLEGRWHRAHAGESHAGAWARAIVLRDKNTRHRDDSFAAQTLTKEGAELIRGRGELTDPRTLTVTGSDGDVTRLSWTKAFVVATGSAAVIPPIDGLEDAGYWTSEDALTSDELPRRLLILGGGPIGCELAEVYASFGCEVTLVQHTPTLLSREQPWLGSAMADALALLGVKVIAGQELTSVSPHDGGVAATVGDHVLEADRLLIAVGKQPRTKGFGLKLLGLDEDSAIPIDARCHATTAAGDVVDDVYALGDVTGEAPYTHTANYHARTVAAHLLGYGVDADHTGIPRVVYTSSAVLCAGLTEKQARAQGFEPITARFDATGTSRSAVERTAQRLHHEAEATLPACVELIADQASGVLLGVAAIGPEADSWAAELALAVRQRMTVMDLAQALHAFPSWTEALHPPARELAEKVQGITSTAGGPAH